MKYTVTCGNCKKVDRMDESDLTDLPTHCTQCGRRLPIPVPVIPNVQFNESTIAKFGDEREI